jgi:tRNA G37 N-methylase TrmD
MEVPAVLRSGDHGAIARWRAEQQRLRTAERRPDLHARWLQAEAAASGVASGVARGVADGATNGAMED